MSTTLFFRFVLEKRGIRSPDEFLPPYRDAAARLGLTNVEPAPKTFEGWFYDGRRPQKVFRPAIVEMLGYSIDDLWTEVPEGAASDFVPLVGTSPIALHGEPGMDLSEMKRSGAMAVRRARNYVLQTDRDKLGDNTLPLLHDQVARLVTEYPRVPLAAIWDDLLDAQDQVIFNLETGKHRPSQLSDLNFMAGVLAFLVAKGFNDMEDREQARTMSLLAAAFAKDAEHPGLMALVNGLQSLIEYWADRPGDALFYAQKGVALSSNLSGTVGLWLLGLQARAAAVLGDAETVRTANLEAINRRESVVLDDLDQLGGLLTYSPEKQTYYTVESEALLGHGGADLTAQAELAVQGFSDRENPNWAFGDLAGAQCNQALVLLYSGEVDGAAEAIRPVLDLPPTYRNNGIVVSANRVRQALMTSGARAALVARNLREEIAVYPPRRPALPSGTQR
uniref:XRE family transcriptional regulator n=1 Tax=Streptomyces sp. NBC_00180 TaxID=2903632 RepID=A0AAU1IC18_9ACTN